MAVGTLSRRGNVLIQRLTLAPGESTPWHVDPYQRVSTVIRGQSLGIEFADGQQSVDVYPGLCGWDEPTARIHRAINTGPSSYEEVTVFFLDDAAAVPQPTVAAPTDC